MNLVTVANPKFYPNAKALIESFHAIYPSGRAFLYWFGNFEPNIPGAEIYPVLQDCPHAHHPGYFYFKVFALADAYRRIGDDFIYTDSRHRFIRRPIEIERRLITTGRFYVKYPGQERYKLKWHTTLKCFQECGFNPDGGIGEKYLYWAAIQAYRPGPENAEFISTFLDLMKKPACAGPSNLSDHPDGPEGCCAHRNDQSVLSILIEKHGFGQPYNQAISNRYGDKETIDTLGGPAHQWDHVIRGRTNL